MELLLKCSWVTFTKCTGHFTFSISIRVTRRLSGGQNIAIKSSSSGAKFLEAGCTVLGGQNPEGNYMKFGKVRWKLRRRGQELSWILKAQAICLWL